MLHPGRSKEARALGVVAGEDPSALEGFGLAHEPDPLASFTQAGVVHLAGGLQAGEQGAFLGRAHPQWHLAHKGGCPFGALVSGPALGRHRILMLEKLGQSF